VVPSPDGPSYLPRRIRKTLRFTQQTRRLHAHVRAPCSKQCDRSRQTARQTSATGEPATSECKHDPRIEQQPRRNVRRKRCVDWPCLCDGAPTPSGWSNHQTYAIADLGRRRPDQSLHGGQGAEAFGRCAGATACMGTWTQCGPRSTVVEYPSERVTLKIGRRMFAVRAANIQERKIA